MGICHIVQRFIAAGADVNRYTLSYRTPLEEAAAAGHLPVVQALIAAGAKVNYTYRPWDSPLIPINSAPLHEAAQRGHIDVVKALFAAGADINRQNSCRHTPYQLANSKGKQAIEDLYVKKRTPEIALILARATHSRLGSESPLAALCRYLLHDIAHLAAQAEFHDTFQEQQRNNSWCIIS